jgi:hypothetical protein
MIKGRLSCCQENPIQCSLDILPGRMRKLKGKGIREASHGFVPVK